MPNHVYKVAPDREWQQGLRLGRYFGSPDDLRDGFIHLSTAEQLRGTLERFFSTPDGIGHSGLVLAAFTTETLGSALKWEPARGGTLFPHLYCPLDPALAVRVAPLEVGADGRHVLPEGLA